jgi:uncharacterized protein (TIGR03086 family)
MAAAGAMRAGVAVLERAVAYALGSLAEVTPAQLARPTPCRSWNLEVLLEHFGDSLAALQEAADERRVTLTPAPACAAVLPRVRDRAVRLLGAWTNAGADGEVRIDDVPASAPLVAGAGAIEVTVHGWDVAQACGRPRPIPPELADELFDLSLLMVRPADRPERFALPIPVPGDAPPAERLLAFLGRTPGAW